MILGLIVYATKDSGDSWPFECPFYEKCYRRWNVNIDVDKSIGSVLIQWYVVYLL